MHATNRLVMGACTYIYPYICVEMYANCVFLYRGLPTVGLNALGLWSQQDVQHAGSEIGIVFLGISVETQPGTTLAYFSSAPDSPKQVLWLSLPAQNKHLLRTLSPRP